MKYLILISLFLSGCNHLKWMYSYQNSKKIVGYLNACTSIHLNKRPFSIDTHIHRPRLHKELFEKYTNKEIRKCYYDKIESHDNALRSAPKVNIYERSTTYK